MGERVLVVDDEEPMRRSLVGRLTQEGLDAASAASGEAALALLEASAFDLVLTDQRMEPGIHGVELARRVRERHADLPVVLLTAYADVQMTVDAMRAGAAHVLEKGSSTNEVIAVIRRELDASARVRAAPPARVGASATQLIGTSAVARETEALIARFAKSSADVLILGETGTGKSLTARAIHEQSGRAAHPFVELNCAALPEDLLNAELFGTVKGAFTGAMDKPGRVELAEGGTLFLDEIGDLTDLGQQKLLRLLQTKEFERLGSSSKRRADLRFIAATHRPLMQRMQEGRFREDLYYRLDKLTLELAPLAKRLEDVAALAQHFMQRLRVENARPAATLTPAALSALTAHTWPGNVRELENFLERLLVVTAHDELDEADVRRELSRRGVSPEAPAMVPASGSLETSLRAYERTVIESTLKAARGDRTQAARLLGVCRRTLYNKLQEHGIT